MACQCALSNEIIKFGLLIVIFICIRFQPKTEKIHAIIERTAAFTAQHGIQMEIMIKAKQKDNAQFRFLNYEDELNAYYKHLVDYIKQGKFVPTTSMVSSSSNSNSNGELNAKSNHRSCFDCECSMYSFVFIIKFNFNL